MGYDMWPTRLLAKIRRLQGPGNLKTWELFPSSLQQMAQWADVYKDPSRKDQARNRLLIYKCVYMEETPNIIYLVALRIHGMLRDFNIDMFGNWSG